MFIYTRDKDLYEYLKLAMDDGAALISLSEFADNSITALLGDHFMLTNYRCGEKDGRFFINIGNYEKSGMPLAKRLSARFPGAVMVMQSGSYIKEEKTCRIGIPEDCEISNKTILDSEELAQIELPRSTGEQYKSAIEYLKILNNKSNDRIDNINLSLKSDIGEWNEDDALKLCIIMNLIKHTKEFREHMENLSRHSSLDIFNYALSVARDSIKSSVFTLNLFDPNNDVIESFDRDYDAFIEAKIKEIIKEKGLFNPRDLIVKNGDKEMNIYLDKIESIHKRVLMEKGMTSEKASTRQRTVI